MLLKSVKYHNFRPFLGDQEIKLVPENHDEDKNVTIILGNNTFGKSTFVLSFIWCLYGESRFTRANDILNKKIENSMPNDSTETAFVEVEFEDDKKLGLERSMEKHCFLVERSIKTKIKRFVKQILGQDNVTKIKKMLGK